MFAAAAGWNFSMFPAGYNLTFDRRRQLFSAQKKNCDAELDDSTVNEEQPTAFSATSRKICQQMDIKQSSDMSKTMKCCSSTVHRNRQKMWDKAERHRAKIQPNTKCQKKAS